ncbi:MAG TPA: DUF1329 domain-containing protein [Gammaproteobacteria bacterium]|nr:DUF1329 domain-containing protein [Gammaproteobacteria bacterium]
MLLKNETRGRVALAALLALMSMTAAAANREDVVAWIASAPGALRPDAGRILTEADMAVIKAYLPPGYAEEFDWPGLRMEIQATESYPGHQTYQDATAKFAGQATLAADGAIENYTAGRPFSDAQIEQATPAEAGLMVGWDRTYRWQYYGYFAPEVAMYYVRGTGGTGPGLKALTGGGTLDRYTMQNYKRVYLNHLAMLPDKGYRSGADDADERFYKDHVEFLEPFDVKGTMFVMERPLDAHEEDQVNSYLPTQRRVRRLSAQERADVYMGTDMTLDDFEAFSGRVLDFEWTYLGKREVLTVASGRSPNAVYFGPGSRVPDDRWQVRNCYAVELKPRFKGHPYSSKIIFFDVETLNSPVAIAFNRDGQVWRIFSALYYKPPQAPDGVAALETSVQRWMGTIATDVLKNTSTVSVSLAEGGSYTPTLTDRQIEKQFNVSALGEGR